MRSTPFSLPPPRLPGPLGSVDRARHVLLVGKTGSGKSMLLRKIAAHDMKDGKGMLLLDPHGDLAAQVLRDVPRRRKNDLQQFDPSLPTCPGLNPLRKLSPDTRSLAVAGILAVMKKLFADSWGPRTEHVFRFALLAISAVRGATLADAAAMLIDESVRRWVVKQLDDPAVLDFWTKEFPGYGQKFGAEVTAPILNKLGALLGSPIVRAVMKRSRPRLDADVALARSRLVIASLAKGRIGDDAQLVMGGFMLGVFQQATMRRADLPPEARLPFSIIIDEFGSFASPPVLDLLAEGRKYGVSIVAAMQSLAALEPSVRHAILGNVGTIVSFRVGAADAEILSAEFAGEFGVKSLTSLDVGEMVVRAGSRAAVIVPNPV